MTTQRKAAALTEPEALAQALRREGYRVEERRGILGTREQFLCFERAAGAARRSDFSRELPERRASGIRG